MNITRIAATFLSDQMAGISSQIVITLLKYCFFHPAWQPQYDTMLDQASN